MIKFPLIEIKMQLNIYPSIGFEMKLQKHLPIGIYLTIYKTPRILDKSTNLFVTFQEYFDTSWKKKKTLKKKKNLFTQQDYVTQANLNR